MAIEEVTFYNVVGDEVNLTNLVNQMVDYYMQKLEVGETRVTDFNEGSEIRNLIEAYAVGLFALLEDMNETAMLPFIETSTGVYLDRIGANPFINLPRIQGKEAEGEVTFTLAEAIQEEFFIPQNTIIVNSKTGLEYSTDFDYVIPIGETSVDCKVTCLTDGTDGNCGSDEITIISELNTDFDYSMLTVTNDSVFTGGLDYEDDEDYRVRLLNNVQSDGFGTMGYYKTLCENIPGVHDVVLVDDVDYTKKIIVNAYTKPTPDNILINVLSTVTDNTNIVLGHIFTVDKPVYTTVNLDILLNVVDEIDTSKLTDDLFNYINGVDYSSMDVQGLFINSPLTREMLLNFLNMYEEILEIVSITSDGSEFNIVEPDLNGVIKLGTVNITTDAE